MTRYQFKGLAHWLKLSLQDADLVKQTENLLKLAEQQEVSPDLLMDLSILLQVTHQVPLALQLQFDALQTQQIYTIKTTKPVHLRVLAIVMKGELMQNTPLECLLDDTDIELTLFYIGPGIPLPEQLPEHDILFMAVGESEHSRPVLENLQPLLNEWHVPVVNQPSAVLAMARSVVASTLQNLEGICMPMNKRLSRYQLERIVQSPLLLPQYIGADTFPLIVRPLNSHAGIGLERVLDIEGLVDYLNRHNESDRFYVAPFVDYSDDQGVFCKYRIAFINGQVFVCHIAMSHHWMIHYANAGMDESAEKRALEARLMQEFEVGFKVRHAHALKQINERMGLDYFGVDCAELNNGDLLIFEVDTSMVVHAYDPIERYEYKQAPMQKMIVAFGDFLKQVAKR